VAAAAALAAWTSNSHYSHLCETTLKSPGIPGLFVYFTCAAKCMGQEYLFVVLGSLTKTASRGVVRSIFGTEWSTPRLRELD
jgi:hypothetical protein